MAVNKYIVFMFTFSCLRCILCQLNLSEDSPCTTNNVTNGRCVRLFRCGSAVLTYLYRNAGFTENNHLPNLPEICSQMNDVPVVCCTDCMLSKREEFEYSTIAPYGILVSTRGPVAWRKCLDFFHRLPYPCRGKGDVQLTRTLDEEKQCHNMSLKVTVATDRSVKQEPWKFPHLALLGYGDQVHSAQWLCEGTVISERFILTAAHCTNAGILGTVAFAALGRQNRGDTKKLWKIYNIKRYVNHPEYNDPSWYHDIALLETETQIRFNIEILPACLDVGIHDISVAGAAGVQSTGGNNTQPQELQTVNLDILSGIECMNTYKKKNNLMHGYDYKSQTCYAPSNRTEDTCKRLAGSPLQVDVFKCQYTVVGVTTFVKECGAPKVADIFTRIGHYLPWIEKIVWPEEV